MFTVNASRIRALMFQKGINGATELAKEARINNLTASKLIKDGSKATMKVIAALARLFDINGEELILKG